MNSITIKLKNTPAWVEVWVPYWQGTEGPLRGPGHWIQITDSYTYTDISPTGSAMVGLISASRSEYGAWYPLSADGTYVYDCSTGIFVKEGLLKPAGSITNIYFWDPVKELWVQDVPPTFIVGDLLQLVIHGRNPLAVAQRMRVDFYITPPKGPIGGVTELKPTEVPAYGLFPFGLYQGEYQWVLDEVGTWKIKLVLLAEVVI